MKNPRLKRPRLRYRPLILRRTPNLHRRRLNLILHQSPHWMPILKGQHLMLQRHPKTLLSPGWHQKPCLSWQSRYQQSLLLLSRSCLKPSPLFRCQCRRTQYPWKELWSYRDLQRAYQ